MASAASGTGDPDRDLIDDALGAWARERPDLKTAPVGVIMRINRLAAHFHAEMNAVFAEFGLSNPSFELLATLRRAGHPYRLAQWELAETLGLTAGTVSLRVKRMLRQGLVTVEPEPADMRVTYVRLTEQGQRLFDEAAPAHLANEEDMVRALSTEEQAALAALLRRLLLSFEGSPASMTPALAVGLRVKARARRASAAGLHGPAGVTVSAVTAATPAAHAGLQRGDVILAVAGHRIRTAGNLDRAISLARRAGRTTMLIRRGQRQHEVTLEWSADPPGGYGDHRGDN